MNLFSFYKKVIFVFIALVIALSACPEANSAGRIGVYSVSVHEGDMTSYKQYSMSDIKRLEQLQKKYTDILMGIFSEIPNFEAVKLITEYEKTMQQVQEAQKKSSPSLFGNLFGGNKQKQEDYKPYVSRGMTSEGASTETYVKYHTDAGAKEKCDYVIDCFIQIENKFATANFTLYDVRKRKMIALPYETTSIISGITPKNSSSSKSSSVKAKSKAKTSSSKSKEQVNPAQEAAQEQAITMALNKLVICLTDNLSGNPAKVIGIASDNVTINKGKSSKVEAGDMFKVQAKISDGMDEIFGADKETLSQKTVAIIKITDVQENSSIAEVINGAGNITLIRTEDTLDMLAQRNLEYFTNGEYKFPNKRIDVKKAEVKPTKPKNNQSTKSSKKTAVKPKQLPALPPGTVRIGIMRFNSDAYEVTDDEALSLTDLLSRMLSNSNKIVVLERDRLEAIAGEQKLNLSGIIDPSTAAEIGKLASCQYILMGSVTGLQESDTISGRYIRPTSGNSYSNVLAKANYSTGAGRVVAGLAILGMIMEATEKPKDNVVTETHETITAVDARLVDVQTSRIIAAFSEKGSAAQSDIITQDKEGHVKKVEANYGSLQNRSIASAAANLGYKIREKLAGEQVQISAINGDEIIINRGDSSGVQVGDLFCVYSDGKTGGDTDAIISVTDVQEAFSTAEIAKSVANSYSPVLGSRLEPVLNSEYQKGIWHIKNQRRAQAEEIAKDNASLEDLVSNSRAKKRFETSATDAKKVIKSYGLSASQEKALINAHSKASKASSTQKKYEAYKELSEKDLNDFLAAYNTGKYALEQSMYIEAREWASKALFVNPNYKPALALIEKIDNGE